jgi:hypothetical protein
MDDVQNRFARELADAVAAAVAQSADVERCRERARSAGYHLHLTLDATVGFAPLAGHESAESAATPLVVAEELPVFEVSANDRRFLRSLRIAADEVNLEEAS